MGNKLFLHIGYPKTGTTALQKHFFPDLRKCGFYYAGYDEQDSRQIAGEFGRLVHHPQANSSTPRQLPQTSLISCEGIIFDCFRYLDATGNFSPLPVTGLAEKSLSAARSFGADNIYIIIVLRRQGELSHSLYAQSFAHYFRHAPDLGSYAEYAKKIIDGDHIAGPYDFLSVVRNFYEVYGQDHVLVLFYEDLVTDQSDFLGQLAKFTGCDLPTRIPAENVRRISNGSRITQPTSLFDELSFLKRKLLPNINLSGGKIIRLMQKIPVRKSITIEARPDIAQKVTEAYRASNKQLGELLDRDLATLGYC